MAWYLAQSLVALRTELNRRWPNRDKTSDGAVGDTAHAARKSDHNPDYDAGGIVRAIDVDKDGIDVEELLRAVVRDPRVAYVIWNRRIASATEDGRPWDWEPYAGANPHDKHIHISIKHTTAAATDTTPWFDAAPTQEEEFTVNQYESLMQQIKNEGAATRQEVRRQAIWALRYGVQTEDERARADAAFDKAIENGKTLAEAIAAVSAVMRPIDADLEQRAIKNG